MQASTSKDSAGRRKAGPRLRRWETDAALRATPVPPSRCLRWGRLVVLRAVRFIGRAFLFREAVKSDFSIFRFVLDIVHKI
jgi:hypothetical protein